MAACGTMPDAGGAISEVWLVIECADRSRHCFEFQGYSRRVIVIGPRGAPDVRADVPGAVAACFERDAQGFWLHPACQRGRFRLDGKAIAARQRLRHSAILEIGRARFTLHVRDSEPTLGTGFLPQEPPGTLTQRFNQRGSVRGAAPSLLARLGTLTLRHPDRVLIAATVGAAILTACLVRIERSIAVWSGPTKQSAYSATPAPAVQKASHEP